MNVDIRWSWFGVTADFLEQKASWLSEKRELHQRSVEFFRLAGRLVSLSRDEYELASLAFFQAIIGLEKALRLHFATEDDPFALLFQKAISQKLVTDAVFSEVRPLQDEFFLKLLNESAVVTITHCEALSVLVPKLRNRFMHGNYLLSPEYLYLTFQLREIADVLKTKNVVPVFASSRDNMGRFVVTTEGQNLLRLRELCERFANDQWTAAHMTPEQAADALLDQFRRAVLQELELLQVECVEGDRPV
jgi:hypothetical protein